MTGFFDFLTITLLGYFIKALEMGITTIELFIMLFIVFSLPIFLMHMYFKTATTKSIFLVSFFFSMFLSLALAPEFNDYITPKAGTH